MGYTSSPTMAAAEVRHQQTIDALFDAAASAEFWSEAERATSTADVIRAKLRNRIDLTRSEAAILLSLIETAEDAIDDGTPGGRKSWAGNEPKHP